jgi:hypothetical protein
MIRDRLNRLGQPDGRRVLDDYLIRFGEERFACGRVERRERAVHVRVESRILIAAVIVAARRARTSCPPRSSNRARTRLCAPLPDRGIKGALSLLLHEHREIELLDIHLDPGLPELFLEEHRDLYAHLARTGYGERELKRMSVPCPHSIAARDAPPE